HDHHDEFCLMP
ncbi:mCG114173, isoform CRA_b, partial [Mus musculus]